MDSTNRTLILRCPAFFAENYLAVEFFEAFLCFLTKSKTEKDKHVDACHSPVHSLTCFLALVRIPQIGSLKPGLYNYISNPGLLVAVRYVVGAGWYSNISHLWFISVWPVATYMAVQIVYINGQAPGVCWSRWQASISRICALAIDLCMHLSRQSGALPKSFHCNDMYGDCTPS